MSLSKTQDQSVTDREKCLKRLGGDQKLFVTLVGFFLEDAPMLMKQLGDAFHAGDFGAVAHRAHSLKGLSSTFEAIPFMELASEIESLAAVSDHARINAVMPQLDSEFRRLISELEPLSV
jgi:HPt (histidine-containing phosphotransfer) domain-containing protein